jgi:hypothetical protein
MINGLTAPYQQTAHARSILGICKLLDLPDGLVELRHDAAHGEMPSLIKLRWAAFQSMSWLYDRYWMKQSTHFDFVKLSTIASLEKLGKLQKVITADNASQRTDLPALKKECKQITNSIMNSLSGSQVLICLVPQFLESPLLVPTKIQASQATRKYTEVPRRLLTMWVKIIENFTAKWDCFLPALLVSIVSKLFVTARLLPRYNPTMSSDRRGYEDQDLQNKFKLSLLRCWYQHLLSHFYDICLEASEVEKAASNIDEEEEERDYAATENGTAVSEQDPQTSDKEETNDEDSENVSRGKSKKKKNRGKSTPTQVPPTSKAQVKKKGKEEKKLENSTLPIKALLHICFHHMNKQSLKLIKLTLCYMPRGPERDAILPKLKTLFHFRSRAMNIVKAEEARKSGGSNAEERSIKLHERADRNSEIYSSQTELSLEDFERLISARSTPMAIVNDSPSTQPRQLTTDAQHIADLERDLSPTATSSQKDVGISNPKQALVAPMDPSSTTVATTVVSSTPNSLANVKRGPVVIDAQAREKMWTPVEGTFPVIGMSPSGEAPADLGLDPRLDLFVGAIFLVPRNPSSPSPQAPTATIMSPATPATPAKDVPTTGSGMTSPTPPLLLATSRLTPPSSLASPPLSNTSSYSDRDYSIPNIMALEEDHLGVDTQNRSRDTFVVPPPRPQEEEPQQDGQGEEDSLPLQEPDTKRRCPAPETLEASPSRDQEHTVVKPALDVAVEKVKIQLLIKPTSKAQKRKK